MKISIAYQQDEEIKANAAIEALRKLFPKAKVKETKIHPPFSHIYIAVKRETNSHK